MRGGRLAALAFALVVTSAAQAATVSGELIDTFCFAHARIAGKDHAACALRCIRAGVPAGVLETTTHRVYVLLPATDATPLPPALLAQAGHRVTIDGDVLTTNGATFLTVRAFRLAR